LNKHKGLKETLEGYLRICDKIPDELYLVGRGTEKAYFDETDFFLDSEQKQKAEEIFEEGKIHFVGELLPEDLRDLYRRCRVFILPSLTEGFPISILEALACGTPVVASDVGSVSDVLKNDINGYLIDKGNSAQLAESILKIVNGNYPRLSKASRLSALEHDINHSAKDYLKLFKEIVEKKKSYV